MDTIQTCATCGGTGEKPALVPARTFFISFLNEPADEWTTDYEPEYTDCPDCIGTGVQPQSPDSPVTAAHVEAFLGRVADLLEAGSPLMAQAIRATAAQGRTA
jgi:hypothetical protein